MDVVGAKGWFDAVGIVSLTLFYLLLKKTRLGISMRATNSDQEVALVLGIPVGRVFLATWFIAGAFAVGRALNGG